MATVTTKVVTVADALGVIVAIGDIIRVLHYGYGIRVTDCGRLATVTRINRAGNLVITDDAYPADPIAAGRALRPSCVGVINRDDRSGGLEGNR